jgi:hypothetical protein
MVLRGLFAALAVLVLAVQTARVLADRPAEPTAGPRGGPAASSMASADNGPDPGLDAGFAALGLLPALPPAPGVQAATAPGCADPVLLTWVDFNGLGTAAAHALLDLPGVPRVVYLGFVGTHTRTAPILGRWAAASLLGLLGLRQGEVPQQVLLLMLPAACPDLQALDWSRLSPWS